MMECKAQSTKLPVEIFDQFTREWKREKKRIYFHFFEKEKMAKYSTEVLQDSPRTGGLFKPKPPLSNHILSSVDRKQTLLAARPWPVLLLLTPIEIFSPHHLCDKGLHVFPGLLRLEYNVWNASSEPTA